LSAIKTLETIDPADAPFFHDTDRDNSVKILKNYLKANTNNGGAFILRKSSASSTGYVITCLERKLSAFEVIHYKVELDENGKYYISDKTDLFSSWKELFLHSPKLITFSPLYNVEFLEKAQYLTKTVENMSPDANETFGLIPNKSQIEKLMSKDRLDENDESKNPNGTTYVTFPMEEDKKNKKRNSLSNSVGT